ncbi:glucan endo-1,3-beta-glucosidase 3-like isoform X2 [Primulina eburnea]|uniref:glucan endo-1,3-beta-glucosidase 3-like isoform X2 n=1 Tax=Primulina eburnea TaxID=1245227 RepID=UPI003C6C5AA3
MCVVTLHSLCTKLGCWHAISFLNSTPLPLSFTLSKASFLAVFSLGVCERGPRFDLWSSRGRNTGKRFMGLLLLALLFLVSAAAADEAFIGVNIGTALTDMPNPTQVVALLKSQQIRHIRLYDADRAMLLALANTGIQVTISVPNDELLGIGQSNASAANWVSRNVLAHVPATNITGIAVGSEVLSTLSNAAPILVSAMKFIYSALVASNLDSQIKVSTPHSSSIILDSFPPSQAFFNRSWDPVMVPLLKFLQSTGSYLMLNVYPYYDYMQSNGVIPLDYALFRPLSPTKEAVDPNTLLHYTNVFDAIVDAAYFAMSYQNFTNIPIVVTETGWPSKGDSSEPDATLENANTYNSNLIRHVLNTSGTPKHPGIAVSSFIYELYNEDDRAGPISEKNWGLFNGNGVPVYILHLTGSGTVLANDTTNQTYCVAKKGADPKMIQAALDWACGPGKVDCSILLQGKPCYEPDTVVAHASYAFNAYYHGMAMTDGTCNFNGVAIISTTDPMAEEMEPW